MFCVTPLCPVKLLGKSFLCCRWLYSICPKYPKPLLKLRGALHRGVNMLPGRVILHMIIFVSLKRFFSWSPYLLMGLLCWTISILGYLNLSYFLQRENISYGPDSFIGIICWTISSPPGLSKISLVFVTFGDWSDFFSITVWWSLICLSVLIIRTIIVFFVSTLDIDYCYTYHLSWRCSVIALK